MQEPAAKPMPADKTPALLSGVITDLMTGGASGGAGTVSAVAGVTLADLMAQRQESARDVLLDEIRSGDRTLIETGEVDNIVAILERYARAAREGAARLNLRLMAKVIARQAHLGNLIADEFLYYADLLVSLRRDEVIALATLHRLKTAEEVVSLAEDERHKKVLELAQEELIPTVFADQDTYSAVCNGLTRTGLLQNISAFGALIFTTTILMDRLTKLADFDQALSRESK